ncbi:hypothetical protein [Ureibacillus chungkukjangi]|uniref:Uncharacterized protein n=1 Tax=Ureibacillus chungkukjangi TaxID=1202712 RepID=A0A318TSX7_9BACL|nr:hypothetical protein [Ureibacillus chungkukjangi]PYF07892.1 hypothetical protein BJ095_10359 [Ureibacillus chungkukjangi]
MTSLKKPLKKSNIFEVKTKEDLKREEFLDVLAEMIYFHIQKNNDKEAVM